MHRLTRRSLLQQGGLATAAASLPLLSACKKKQSNAAATGLPLSLQAPWVNDAEFIGYFVALTNGYYEAEHVNLMYKSGGPDKVSGEVLAAKACDVALTNIDGTVSSILDEGAPFKIIGAQYQKSPLGIVSLAESGIRKPSDLVGKKVAVPSANRATIEAFLHLNSIDPMDVRIVDYQYDVSILIDQTVDATVDFVTNVPYTIRLRNKNPYSFLLFDFGFRQCMDTVVVRAETLTTKRRELVGFLRASRRGWVENFRDVKVYPPKFKDTFFKDSGRTVDNEEYFNTQEKPLIETPNGIFSLDEETIEQNIASLNATGLKARRDMFDTSLLREV